MIGAQQGENWRLALDVGPVRLRSTGVGVYAGSLARALAAELPGRLTLIGGRQEVALDGYLPSVPVLPFRSRNYQVWLHRRADADARRAGAQLVHYTNAGAPLLTRLPFVLTVHDLSLLRMPQFHPTFRLGTLPATLAAIARAAAIIVPSRSTARDLGRALRVAGRRVTVVEHAAQAAPGPPDPAATAAVCGRLGLDGRPYLVAVGTVEPRKNHRRLAGAFERVAAEFPELRLVLVGEAGWRSGPIYRRLRASRVRDRIVIAGYLPRAELAALIAGSAAVCYVSLYEGFGLPVVEAMALGTPVVTSRVSSMPQAAGGAAVLVDPRDETDIARGLREALARRDELVELGRLRTSGRTWRDVATETLEVYRWAERGA